ncbi:phage tail tube protein [uncultured Draconibacterium sp.]|uniref:phage tail tube protein n=1 Tax=uncultured Draconibacterium sp. TaxID=1573823 RepID=UPI003260E6A1
MAANTGFVHGGDILLYQNTGTDVAPVWTPFAHATSHKITHPTNIRTINTKTLGPNTGVKAGLHGQSSLSMSGLKTYDDENYFTLKSLRDNRTRIQFKLAGRPVADTDFFEVNEQSGDSYEEGYGYITSLSSDHPHDANATFEVEIAIDGNTEVKTVS